MTPSEILADIEIKIISALAKFGRDLNQDERDAFRLGFLAGAQHGLDTARKEMREICRTEREFP